MRKIINSTYISLDGVVEQPHEWPTIERPSDERGGQIQTSLLMACDAVLMGRRTYDGFAPVWQTRSGDPLSDRMNTMPKYVVSTTLRDPDWANTTVISGRRRGTDPRAQGPARPRHRAVRLRRRIDTAHGARLHRPQERHGHPHLPAMVRGPE